MAVLLGEIDVARVIAVTVNGSQRMHCARSDRDAPLQPAAVSTLGRGGGSEFTITPHTLQATFTRHRLNRALGYRIRNFETIKGEIGM